MRHFFGIVLAVFTAALVYVAAGWGVNRIIYAHAHNLGTGSVLVGFAVLVVTGLFLGIFLSVRAVSPLTTGLPGLGLLALSALAAVNSHRATQLIPLHSRSFSFGFADLLTTGVLALAGMVMIIPLFVPSRWRSAEPVDEFADMGSDLGMLR